jgi:prepilin peptidase CpaA
MLEIAPLLIFPASMVFAALSDVLTLMIPNWLSLALAALYFPLAIYFGIPVETIGLHLICGVIVLAVGFAIYSRGWLGAGDAKLAAATALWLGWSNVLDYVLFASLIGAAIALILFELQRRDLPRFLLKYGFVSRFVTKNSGVPYGVALALAGLLVYPQTAMWLHLIRR